MATLEELPSGYQRLVLRLHTEVVGAICPDKSGHMSNCDLDIPNRIICNCVATGNRIGQALVDVVHVELRALDPEFTEYLRLKTKFGDV